MTIAVIFSVLPAVTTSMPAVIWTAPADPGETGLSDGLEWLVMLYMAGDNDLGRDGYKWGNALKMDLEEIESSYPGQGNRVLALTDQEGPGNSALYNITFDDGPGIASPAIPLGQMDGNWTDELDMSDPATLQRFVRYGVANHPAEKTALIIWDHGSGWYMKGSEGILEATRGFAIDQNSGYSQMYMDEMRSALELVAQDLGGLSMDLVAFDTCFMGMVEVMYQVAPFFHVGVGSPDEEPFYGYNYTFLSSLPEASTPKELGSSIVRSFVREYGNSTYSYPAIGVIDLDVLKGDFLDDLDHLSSVLIQRMWYLEKESGGLFNSVVVSAERIGSENIDLGDLLTDLAASGMDGNVTSAASECLQTYSYMMLDNWTKEDGRNPEGTGVCIYLPLKTMFYKTAYDGSSGFLSLSRDCRWDEMVREYQNPIERVRLEMEAVSLDQDGARNDLSIRAFDPRYGNAPIEGASVFLEGSFQGRTDLTGAMVLKDLQSGSYRVEVHNGSDVGIGTIRVMNRPPVPVLIPDGPVTTEGTPLTLDASYSFDPDGDRVRFEWDLDSEDGLDDVDSTDASVTFPDRTEGLYPISLRVSDGLDKATLSLNVTVLNGPPIAWIHAPSEVAEDESFNVSAEGSDDYLADMDGLMFLFKLDGADMGGWTKTPFRQMEISTSGYHTVSVHVLDPSGASDNDSTVLKVNNLAPVPVITGPITANEDQAVSFSAKDSRDTPSDRPTLNMSWSLDGGTTFDRKGEVLETSFQRAGPTEVRLRVTDDDGAASETPMTVTVRNIPPKAAFSWTRAVIEDQKVLLNASASWDTGNDLAALNYSWDVGGDGLWDLFGVKAETSFGIEGEHDITLRTMDDDGSVSFSSGRVMVSNKAPDPAFKMPLSIDEDEELTIDVLGMWDTPSDEPQLEITWKVDGKEAGSGRDPPRITFTTKGQHSVVAEAVDDQGSSGSFEAKVNVFNPPPVANMSHVPRSMGMHERLFVTAEGSYDTQSDMGALTFEWTIDGRSVGNGSMELTLGELGVGNHVLVLRATDDEGAWREATARFKVRGSWDIGKYVDALLSPMGILVMLSMVLFLLGLGAVLTKRVTELSPPSPPEPDVEGNLLQGSDQMSSDIPSPVESPSDPGPPDGIPVGENDEASVRIPPMEIPPVQGSTFLVEVPGPPDLSGFEMPDLSPPTFEEKQ